MELTMVNFLSVKSFASSNELHQMSMVTLSKLQNVLCWECVVKYPFAFNTVTAMF
jgi:hypothetical protein